VACVSTWLGATACVCHQPPHATTTVQDDLQEAELRASAQAEARSLTDAPAKQSAATKGAQQQLDRLTTRVDDLKSQLAVTEQQLAAASDKLVATAKAQEDRDSAIAREDASRRKSEVEVQQALERLSASDQTQRLAELRLEDVLCALEHEQKLRQQAAADKDEVRSRPWLDVCVAVAFVFAPSEAGWVRCPGLVLTAKDVIGRAKQACSPGGRVVVSLVGAEGPF
jgi:hypothetical protein